MANQLARRSVGSKSRKVYNQAHLLPYAETGTIVSIVYDILKQRITTLIAFSKGHWEHSAEAHGDKRNPEDFERWRGLSKIGTQTDRYLLAEQADIVENFKGPGDLKPIDPSWPTI